EGFALTALLMWLLDFSFFTAGLTAFMLAAVSPAVVVPSMLDLRSRGLGQRNGIITVILAGASVDDVFAITMFTVFLGLAEGAAVPVLAGEAGLGVSAAAAAGPGTLGTLLGLPLALFGGLAIGLLLGLVLAWWFKKHHESIRATEKMLLLLASALFLVQIGNWFHLAALLGVMAVGFVLLEKAETVAHELAAKLGKIWIFAQILLFVIIGLSLELPALQAVGGKALLALALGLAARSFGVLLATWPSAMSLKERWFCVIAYLPKATVQAALGGVALAAGLPEGRLILAIAVLAIVVTAPLGLIGIRLGARYLLD
ncbi:MAG: cation:proton antiporter, partial [Spirochaetes bacterium]|nr:cation:proton antiporter [Spirochaetota bacterium]